MINTRAPSVTVSLVSNLSTDLPPNRTPSPSPPSPSPLIFSTQTSHPPVPAHLYRLTPPPPPPLSPSLIFSTQTSHPPVPAHLYRLTPPPPPLPISPPSPLIFSTQTSHPPVPAHLYRLTPPHSPCLSQDPRQQPADDVQSAGDGQQQGALSLNSLLTPSPPPTPPSPPPNRLLHTHTHCCIHSPCLSQDPRQQPADDVQSARDGQQQGALSLNSLLPPPPHPPPPHTHPLLYSLTLPEPGPPAAAC